MQTINGSLKHGLKIGPDLHKEFELRELTTQDMFDCEQVADADKPLTFNAALMCRQLVKIGSYTGPFTVQLIGKLKPSDYAILRRAQAEADALGEA